MRRMQSARHLISGATGNDPSTAAAAHRDGRTATDLDPHRPFPLTGRHGPDIAINQNTRANAQWPEIAAQSHVSDPRMLRNVLIATGLLAVLGAATLAFLSRPQQIPQSALGAHTPDLANGKLMFEAGGCSSCHAIPGEPDKQRLGGGLALHSPFGTFYMPNISPDRQDG